MTRVAVVGAGGCVGREMLALLEAEPFSAAAPVLFGSERSRGRLLPFAGGELPVNVLGEEPVENIDVALFAAGKGVSREWAPRFVDAGAVVVDNSSAYRLDDDVPLVVPEVNADSVGASRGIIANPNCSTIILMLPLHALRSLGRCRVVASTYQAVSGAGQAGLDALERERRGGGFEPGAPFPFPIENNLFPLIGAIADDVGRTEEEYKMVQESRKILGLPDLEIHVTCVRVGVERCHSESVTMIFDEPVDLGEAETLLADAAGVVLERDPVAPPTPIDCSRRHEVTVGRLRSPAPEVLQFWVVGDQLLKGAALNAVQIARLLPARSA